MPRFRFVKRPKEDLVRQIIALYRQAGWWPPEAPDDCDHVSRLIAGSHCFLVACQGRRLVGMGRAISDRASDAYIQDVVVAEGLRGHGIGSRIVAGLRDRLQRDGLHWIGLIAENNSTPFYRPLGFAPMPRSTPMLHHAGGTGGPNDPTA
jgi:spermidine synthase